MEIAEAVRTPDPGPSARAFRADLLDGLQRCRKSIPCKYFYDARGSRLFDRICELDVYYPMRTEKAIMRRGAGEMAACIGPRARIVEYGSGSSLKTRLLLDVLDAPAGYVPIDISREHLRAAAHRLAQGYPHLPVQPVCADYTGTFTLPAPPAEARRTVIYFPGSTIGNFDPEAARVFLARMAEAAGPDGGLLVGVDLKKDRATLEAAYNDPEGVTAAFNKNVLLRANRELGANFDVECFAHRAFYNVAHGCIEMHLVSREDQAVTVGDVTIAFAAGESIRTERSYKYAPDEFAALAARAGFAVEKVWTDDAGFFSVQYAIVRRGDEAQNKVKGK